MPRSFELEPGEQPVRRYPIALSGAFVLMGIIVATVFRLPDGAVLRALVIGLVAGGVWVLETRTASWVAAMIAIGGLGLLLVPRLSAQYGHGMASLIAATLLLATMSAVSMAVSIAKKLRDRSEGM